MQQGNPYNDEHELFRQMSIGDESAFVTLFHRYTPKLLPFVTRLTRSPEQARELVQEIFLQLWVQRAKLGEIQNPAGWIFRIASNLSMNWMRNEGTRRRKQQEIYSQAISRSESTDEPMVEAKQLESIIHKAVDALPEKRQAIYRLSREQGLNHQQIADQLQISPNTVKNQIGIALKFIQEFIRQETGLSIVTIVLLFGL